MPTLTVKIVTQAYDQPIINRNVLILLSLLMGLTGCSFLNITPTPPIKIPIALHKAGSVVETEVRIAQDDRITLQLRFFVNDQPGDRDRLLDFVGRERKIGGVFVAQAVTVPLRVKILKYADAKELVILNKTYETTGRVSAGATGLSRLIDNLSMEAGTYRISLETIKNFPDLNNNRVEFWIHYIRAPK